MKISEFDQLNKQLTRFYSNEQLISLKDRNKQFQLIQLITKLR